MSGRAQELFDRLVSGGMSRINDMIASEETEELFLDYKRSADDGRGTRLHDTDRQNLARAVSGFGNSEGGLVIWGVDCRPTQGRGDVPTRIVPIDRPVRFKSWLEQVVSGLTVPAHGGVRHHAIVQDNNDSGIVLSLIPSGNHSPYQTTGDLRYLMRAGSNFLPVPHAVLSGLFGRRPQPTIIHNWVLHPSNPRVRDLIPFSFSILLRNLGPSIAEDVFINAMGISKGGEKCTLTMTPGEAELWEGTTSFSSMISAIIRRDKRLPPLAHFRAMTFDCTLASPFTEALKVHVTYGAAGAPVTEIERGISVDKLSEAWVLIEGKRPGEADFREAHRRSYDLLKAALPSN